MKVGHHRRKYRVRMVGKQGESSRIVLRHSLGLVVLFTCLQAVLGVSTKQYETPEYSGVSRVTG